MKPLLVVNPRSAGGATGRAWNAMRPVVEKALGPFDVRMTARQGHGIDLAREGALEGRSLVVAVGGDGTFHEVVNGLLAAKGGSYGTRADATRVGLIGQGTGGDFRRTLGIEHRLDRYLVALASGRERAIDVGRFSGGGKTAHYFVNILSAGMGGLVDRYVASTPRLFGGKAAYFGASLRALINIPLGHLKCKVTRDGATEEHEFRSFMVAVCNGRYFGGGMKVAPMAEVDDGALDLVALGATSKAAFAIVSRDIYEGAHISRDETVKLRGQAFELDLANESARSTFLLDVDGEPMGPLPLKIEIVPRAIVLRG